MKHLRETFTDQEFAELKTSKAESKLNWHDFIRMSRWFYEQYAQVATDLKCDECGTPLISVESYDGRDSKYTCWKCDNEQWI
jgi:hypothetical protein